MSTQPSLFDSVIPDYVDRCLELGAKIVKRGKGTVGTVLCPSCKSEKYLRPEFQDGTIIADHCGCGHSFKPEEAMILTFQGVDRA